MFNLASQVWLLQQEVQSTENITEFSHTCQGAWALSNFSHTVPVYLDSGTVHHLNCAIWQDIGTVFSISEVKMQQVYIHACRVYFCLCVYTAWCIHCCFSLCNLLYHNMRNQHYFDAACSIDSL